MFNISKFINAHVPLCVFSLGLAIVGYLGYRAVRWIINTCRRTEKVDQVAQKNIHNQSPSPSPKSLINRVDNLEMSSGKVTMGQGEYVLFHKLPTGEKRLLSPETFEQVYHVLLQHSPAALVNSGPEKASEACGNRYELVKAKLKEIDPTLEAIFIPRTLYELFFIRKCIEEDLKHKEICPLLSPFFHTRNVNSLVFKGDQRKYEEFLKDKEITQKQRKCWHLCYFTDAGDSKHAGVKQVAYRLNQVLVKALNPSNEGFTHREFSAFAEKEIDFLKTHYKNGLEIEKKRRGGEKVEEIGDCSTPGPTTNFGCESTRGSIKPMGIRNQADAQIIRDAIALDCSKIAQDCFFLYRGADFQKDSTSCWSDKNTPYSLSFGSSLFAGCLYDGGATAFHYMRNGKNGYAIPVPFDQLNKSPFFAPPTHPIAQLFGHGEIFHARTKAWKDFDVNAIQGMNTGGNSHVRNHLKSNLSKEELASQFQTYKNNAFQLK